jgi:hypothetical protein
MWEEDVRIIGVEMKSFNTNRTDNGEGKPLCIYTFTYRVETYTNVLFYYFFFNHINDPYKWSIRTDVEGRRLREWRGLDTPVAWADNDECHRLA